MTLIGSIGEACLPTTDVGQGSRKAIGEEGGGHFVSHIDRRRRRQR